MQGDRQNVGIYVKYLLHTISMVTIDVYVENPIKSLSQDGDGKSRIVKNTKSRRIRWHGMVQAAPYIEGATVFSDYTASGVDAGTREKSRSFVNSRKDGSVIAAETEGKVRLLQFHCGQVFYGMHTLQIGFRGWIGLDHACETVYEAQLLHEPAGEHQTSRVKGMLRPEVVALKFVAVI